MGKSVYIVDGARTPFRKFGTDYKNMSSAYLGAEVVKSLLLKTGIKDSSIIDEIAFGCVSQPADTMNIARYISMHAGIDESVPAVSVHRNCASGMEAITHCASKIKAEEGDIYFAGGVENMTQMPFLYNKSAVEKYVKLSKAKKLGDKLFSLLSFRPSDFAPLIGLKLGLSDTLCDMNMGQTAELLAREYSISRSDQDRWANESHQKAITNQNLIEEEIIPVYIRNDDCIKSYSGYIVTDDNGPRVDSTVVKLQNLRTVFDRAGSVTAGNSSQLTDGACGLILMSEEGLKKTGCEPIAEIIEYQYTGCDPSRMGLGPVHAINKCENSIEDADLIEINEAFAAQTLAVIKELNLDINKINVKGGAIALGHPVGASGARIILTLAKELKRRDLQKGCATLCVGGGQGGAVWIKAH